MCTRGSKPIRTLCSRSLTVVYLIKHRLYYTQGLLDMLREYTTLYTYSYTFPVKPCIWLCTLYKTNHTSQVLVCTLTMHYVEHFQKYGVCT